MPKTIKELPEQADHARSCVNEAQLRSRMKNSLLQLSAWAQRADTLVLRNQGCSVPEHHRNLSNVSRNVRAFTAESR